MVRARARQKTGSAALAYWARRRSRFFREGRGELAQEATPSGEQGELDALLQEELECGGGDLDVAEDQHPFYPGRRNFQEDGVVFGYQEPLAFFVEQSTLFGKVEEHGRLLLPGLVTNLPVGA
jgi:hypothetical protein